MRRLVWAKAVAVEASSSASARRKNAVMRPPAAGRQAVACLMANDTSSLGALYAGNKKPAQFGRIFKPDPAWLAKAAPEPILDPALEIIDTHHHLWDMPGYRYLLDDFLADANTGHKVVATVFEECRAMYRARGPQEMKPVGEVEFCAGVAAMSDSGRYGDTRVAAGIVGHADLTLGDRVAAVLEA